MKNCEHENTWFDRSLCPEPCSSMHTICSDCGLQLDGCHNGTNPARPRDLARIRDTSGSLGDAVVALHRILLETLDEVADLRNGILAIIARYEWSDQDCTDSILSDLREVVREG